MKQRILSFTISLVICSITWAQNPYSGAKNEQTNNPDVIVNRPTDHRSPHGNEIPIVEQPFRPSSLIPKGFLPVIASLPLAYIEDAPTKLELMPQVIAQSKLSHTSAGDEVYDISKWFKGAIRTNSITKQWVYYNNTSKHLIMNGDIFLRTHLHDYVLHQIYDHPKQLRINIEYVEVDDKVALNLDEIRKSKYKLLYKNSLLQTTYERFSYGGEFNLTIEGSPVIGKGIQLGSVALSLEIEAEGFGRVLFNTIVNSGQTVVKELGASPFGKKKLLILNVNTQNADDIAIIVPPSQAEFERDLFEIEDDPFALKPYIVNYKVDDDFLELVINAKNEKDMTDQKEALLVPKDHPFFSQDGKVYDLAPLLRASGLPVDNIKSCAYLKQDAHQIIAYFNRDTHEIMENLLATLGGDPPEFYNLQAQIYEVDEAGNTDRSAFDLLQADPKPLLKLAVPITHAYRSVDRENLVKSELGYFRSSSQDDIELELDLKSGGIQFKGSFLIHRHEKIPKVFEIAKSNNPGRVYVIVLEVEQLQEIPTYSYP